MKVKSFLVIMVLASISISANAQIGNALKSVKDKVKQEQPSNQQSTKQESTSRSTKQAEGNTKDPNAEEGFTKSPAQIRAAYKAFDFQIYLRPYNDPKLRHYYYFDKSQDDYYFKQNFIAEAFRRDVGGAVTGLVKSSTKVEIRINTYGLSRSYNNTTIDTIPAGNTDWKCYSDCIGRMPEGIHAVMSGFALFRADPQGVIPFMKFCEAVRTFLTLEQLMDWESNRSKEAISWAAYRSDVNNEMKGLSMVAMGKNKKEYAGYWKIAALPETPLKAVKDAAIHFKDKLLMYEGKGNYEATMYYFGIFETAMYYLLNHNNRDDANSNDIIGEYLNIEKRYKEWDEAKRLSGRPIEMPKTYDMGADLAKKALDAAQNQFESFKVDKVVFISNNWSEYKEPKYPYRVMHRSINAALLTKVGDKWLIRYYYFKQASDQKGGWIQNYGFEAGSDSEPKSVNYKN